MGKTEIDTVVQMEITINDPSPAEVVVKKRKISCLIPFLIILGCFVAWVLFGDAIRERIDRNLVRNARYVSGEALHESSARPGSANRLAIPNGKWVKVGTHVKCYGRSLSHHAWFGLRSGYSFIQVNGRMYGKQTGPCRNTIHVVIDVDSMDTASVVTEEIFVKGLIMGGFHPMEE